MSHECTPCGKCGACSICERCICKPILDALEDRFCGDTPEVTSLKAELADANATVDALREDLVKADEVIKALTDAINRRTQEDKESLQNRDS